MRPRKTPASTKLAPLLAGEWPDPSLPPERPAPRSGAPEAPSHPPGLSPAYAGEILHLRARRTARVDLADALRGPDQSDQSPALTSSFLPGVEGVDAMIAVGHTFVVVTQDHRIAYFDRSGKPLPSKSGEQTNLTATQFFQYLLKPFNADGSANNNCINRHLQFPPDAVAACDLTKYPPQLPCVNEFYDTRCTYDPKTRRFFICSAARNQIWPGNPGGGYDILGRRYFAFAVSKTEDPRDGFRIWFWNDNKRIADWPYIAVNGDNFIVTHHTEQSGKPLAYVFSVAAMLQGKSSLPHWTYNASDVGGNEATLVPVTHHGDTGGLTYLVRPGSTFEIFAFPGSPAGGAARPQLLATSVALGAAPSMLRAGAIYRGGEIYFTCMTKITERVADQGGPRMSVRLVRIPVTKLSATSIKASADKSAGFLDHVFGRNAPEDAPDDLVSYELPALAVNRNGAMVMVYGRVGVTTQTPLFPEARYSVYYPYEATQRRSRVLQKGDFLPTSVHAGETKATGAHYFDKGGIDYASAVVDPADDLTVWMIHEFANKTRNGYKTVVGAVKT
jgi:hypothetical protein